MPGRPRDQVSSVHNTCELITSTGITTTPTSYYRASSSTMAKVSFIPAQMDGLASTTTEAARENPLRLLMRDAGVLIKMLRYLPCILLPFRIADPSAELYMGMSNTRDTLLQSWLFLIETVLLLLAVPATLVLPGGILIAVVALCCIVVRAICLPMHGPRIVRSAMDRETVLAAKQHEDERWIFVNGCITGYVIPIRWWMLNNLADTFQSCWAAEQLQSPREDFWPSHHRYSQ